MSIARPWEASYPPALRDYQLDLRALPRSMDAIAAESRDQFGERPAFTIVLPNGLHTHLNYAQIDAHSDAFAAYLAGEVKLVPGDVLAIQMPNSLQYPVAVFGAWKAGVIVTNVNPLYTERELREQLVDSGAKVLLTHSMALTTAAKVAREVGIALIVIGYWEFFPGPFAQAIRAKLTADMGEAASALDHHMGFEQALAEGARLAPLPRRGHPVALYQYTGGTTGRSKGAVLTHGNLAAVLKMTEDFVAGNDAAFEASDVVLTVLPMYHIFAFVINFLMFFKKGAHNVLVPNPRPLANLRPAFEQFPVSWMTGVDTLYAGLMTEAWFRDKPPKLRYALSGGTALRPSTGEQWRQMVCPILEGYGMTETSCIIAFNPPNSQDRVGSVGLPMPGSDVRVVSADGSPVDCGVRGELQVRGPHVTEGYLNRPEENQSAFVDGWLRTGDIVVMADDGAITIVDRLKDMVLVSGFNVYPNEVEAIIAAHPDVADVAVIGVPDDTTGEAVCACIVARRDGLSAADIQSFCRKDLTAYKVPKHVRFLDQLPKSPVGKVLRAQLRDPG